jgi:hypothetical protein
MHNLLINYSSVSPSSIGQAHLSNVRLPLHVDHTSSGTKELVWFVFTAGCLGKSIAWPELEYCVYCCLARQPRQKGVWLVAWPGELLGLQFKPMSYLRRLYIW